MANASQWHRTIERLRNATLPVKERNIALQSEVDAYQTKTETKGTAAPIENGR